MKKRIILLFSTGFSLAILFTGCSSAHKMMKQAEDSQNYKLLKNLARKRLNSKRNDPYANAMLGKVFLAEGKPDSALFYYEKAHQIDPQNAVYKSDLLQAKIVFGDTLLRRQSPLKARDVFLEAVAMDSSHYLALCRTGLVYKRLGKYDTAQEYYRKAYHVNSYADSIQKILDFFDAAHVQSNLLMRKGIEALNSKNYRVARESLEQAVKAKPDNKEALYHSYLANGLYFYKRGSLGRLWDAIENFGLASSTKPEAAEPHFYMADAYLKKDDKDFENAIREYEEVIRLAPNSDLARKAGDKIKELKAREKLLKDFWKKK